MAVFSGHANSHDNIAGYHPSTLGAALQTASQQVGTLDLLILEGCRTGTLEALLPLTKGARYALVSQLPMAKVGLPWKGILEQSGMSDLGPRELGETIVRMVEGLPSLPTLSLIDLEQIEPLARSLESLAPLLPPERVAEAMRRARVEAPGAKGLGQKLFEEAQALAPASHSVDLKAFLDNLDGLSPEAERLKEHTAALLARAVVAREGQVGGGLSVEGTSFLFEAGRYKESTGLHQWGALLADQQWAIQKPLARAAATATEVAEDVRTRFGQLVYGQAS
jgi:hypothetical protein